jgi:misacylated tRNA(Ala) deacylase
MASDIHGRTHRLELADATLRDWQATVLDASEGGVVLDRSAFYPGGGGQPPDHGVLLWGGVQARVVGVHKGDDLVLQLADGDPVPTVGAAVQGAIEDERRSALMRTHSALHLLAGVVWREFGALVTGGNMEPLSGRLDFNLPEIPTASASGWRSSARWRSRPTGGSTSRCCRARRRSRSQTSSVRRPTCCRPSLPRCGSSTSSGSTRRRTAARMSPSTRQIGDIEIVKVESKGKANRRMRVALR